MLFLQFDASEHAPLVSRVTADTNHRVNEMSRISGNELVSLETCHFSFWSASFTLNQLEIL